MLALLHLTDMQPARSCDCTDANLYLIDSSILKQYDFIALVKVTAEGQLKTVNPEKDFSPGFLHFRIIELFKGKPVNEGIQKGMNTSCDIGFSMGAEWIVFGKMNGGKMTFNPCDRNVEYRDPTGLRDWESNTGFDKLGQLRKLYGHQFQVWDTGTRREYFPSGQIEIEAHYTAGKLHGVWKTWYPNGVLRAYQLYTYNKLDSIARPLQRRSAS